MQSAAVTALGLVIGGYFIYAIFSESLGEELTIILIAILASLAFLYFNYEFVKEDFEPQIKNLQLEKQELFKRINKINSQIEHESVINNQYKRQIASLNNKISALHLNSEELLSKSKEEIDVLLSKFNSTIKEKSKTEESLQALEIEKAHNEGKLGLLENKIDTLIQEVNVYKKSLLEKSAGFPTLLNAIKGLEEIRDKEYEKYLLYKKNPSKKGAEVVKEQTRKRREAEFELRKTKSVIEYYESIAPFLLDLKEEMVVPEDETILEDYTEEEKLDPVVNYLTKEEFRKLSSTERNQRALDRFWNRPKSKALIGRLYERYVGYLFEQKGYDVEYVGIFKGYEDLGRDLICSKGKEMVVVQCKNWSQFRTIYEKHIFQFFGTVFQYKDENRDRNVKAVFCTTTKLSDIARRFAKELKIDLQENHKFDQKYPCIKCNISRVGGTKIYHLPFDQQYDKVKIEPHTGEFYCSTVEEAENAW